MVFGDEQRVIVNARYDNLGKGAAGAAIQNLNIMLGMQEELGL
jgi:N-acetyl-gamma-glutamyl-phosphate reductase